MAIDESDKFLVCSQQEAPQFVELLRVQAERGPEDGQGDCILDEDGYRRLRGEAQEAAKDAHDASPPAARLLVTRYAKPKYEGQRLHGRDTG